MALINCPDCGREVSKNAPNCIHCGAPIAAPMVGREQIVTIQQSSKQFKAIQLLSVLCFIVAVVEPGLAWLGAIAILTFIGATFGKWWHHG